MKVGSRLYSAVCDTMVVLVKAADGVDVACGGVPMLPEPRPDTERGPMPGHGGGTLLGKRYVDAESGLEALCVKAGRGSLSASGRSMTVKAAKQLPASD